MSSTVRLFWKCNMTFRFRHIQKNLSSIAITTVYDTYYLINRFFKMEILLFISTEKMDLSDPFFCMSVLIVYIFIERWMWVIVFLNLLYPNFYYSY